MVDVKSNSVKLLWSTPPTLSLSPITSYEITIKDMGDFTEKKIAIVDIKKTKLVVKNLKPSTTYQFSIIAKNKLGSGTPREAAIIETLAVNITSGMTFTSSTII